MKKIASLFLILLTSCGDPSLSGIPVAAVVPDPVLPLYQSIRVFTDAAGVTMTAAAAVGTEMTNNVSRVYIDLTNFSEARAQFNSSLASALIGARVEYSLNDGSSWATLVPDFYSGGVAFAATKSAFATIPDDAKTEVLLRVLIIGNGALNPIIRYVSLDIIGETDGLE